jgi:chondroitin AC lyase
MVWKNIIDYSTVGREITRKDKSAAPTDWTLGPVSSSGPAYELDNAVQMLAALPVPRRKEFQEFASSLHGRRSVHTFVGNKQFWCSDFMVHRRTTFYTSVKMHSDRMLNGEFINQERKRSQHLSDGVNFLYQSGQEYQNIFPVWDWTKLPGTTKS